MPFGSPIVGGAGALIRPAISSPDYVAGSTGWTINRDGSAEFNNVTIRGTLTTGPAGVDHVTIPAGAAEVDFVLGANGATARARTAQLGAGASARAGIDLESSLYPDPTAAFNERSVIHLRGRDGGGQINIGFFRDDLGVDVSSGIEIVDQGGGGDGVTIKSRTSVGNDVGGQLAVGSLGFNLDADISAGGTFAAISGNSGGIQAAGKFVSASAVYTPVFTPAANWTLTSFDLAVWGPFCVMTVVITRNAAAVAAGAVVTTIGTLSFSSTDTAFPAQISVCAGEAGGAPVNAAIGFLTPAGVLSSTWSVAGFPIGGAIRFSVPYFKAP